MTTIGRRILAYSFALVMACATAAAGHASPTFYVMRHLDSRGTGQDERLSEVGANRARRLMKCFQADRPAAIYVSTTQVALDTSAWLAVELNITPKIFDPSDLKALVPTIAEDPKPVLIIANNAVVAQMAALLAGGIARPADDIDFGDMWVIDGSKAERSTCDM